ncbi:MAG: YfhO family protein [Oscillospiraceae bacterium]|nr:YfhO family protein [Oscillospiraceae bacterium]
MVRNIAARCRTVFAASGMTLILFLIGYAVYGLYPFGGRSIVWCDMEQQAVPLLMQLREMAERGESIGFSALNAGGMRFFGVFFFFLSNPFSLLIFLTDIRVDLLVNLIVPAKLILASGTAAIWLRRRTPALHPAHTVLLAVMYGCSGYGLFYYQNLMWLDVMVVLPLLMIALDILFRQGDARPYFLILCIIMTLCFYIGYMIAIYVLLETAVSVRYLVPQARRGATAQRFWLASGFAALVTAPVWVPSFLQVMDSARSGGLAASLMDSYLVNNLSDKLGLLGCTAICIAVLPSLWRREQTPTPDGSRARVILLLLTVALLFDPINAMWHTGSYQAFPFRWAMIPILLLLTAAAKLLTQDVPPEPERRNDKRLCALICGMILLCAAADALLMRYAGKYILSYIHSLWVSEKCFFLMLTAILPAVAGYWLCLGAYRSGRLRTRTCSVFLAALFLCEFTLSFHCYIGKTGSEDKLYAQTVSAAHRIDDDEFYRVRPTKKYAHANMIGALGYPTLAHYTSLTRADFMHGVKRMGYSSYWMEVTGPGGTVLTDALWCNRYLLGQKPDFPDWTEPVWSDNVLSVARSSLTLPGAIAVDAAPEDITGLPDGSRAEVQAELGRRMLGLDGDFVTVYPAAAQTGLTLSTGADGITDCRLEQADTPGEIRFAFFVRGKQALYFDSYSQTGTRIQNPLNKSVTVQMNGRIAAAMYPDNSMNGICYLGTAENEYVSVRVSALHDFQCESFGVFGMNLDQFASAAAAVNGAELHYSGGVYSAQIRTDAPKTVVLSAAYDESFTATVNGEPAAVYRVNDCQTAVRVPAGESEIVLRSHVRGLGAGILLACLGLLAAAVLYVCRRRLPAQVKRLSERLSAAGLQAAFAVMLLVVYVMPVVLCVIGGVQYFFIKGG